MAKEQKQPEDAGARPQSQNTTNVVADMYFGVVEKTTAESSMVRSSQLRPYNPDDLFQKRNDYYIYEQMKLDDQIHVCMQIKKDLVIGSGWDVVVEKDGDDKVAKAIKALLEDSLDTPFDDLLEELIDCSYSFGFALSEKVFKVLDSGELTLKSLKTRHPGTWIIHTDDQGNIERYQQYGAKNKDLTIAPKSLIHMVNAPQWQNPYGRADLRPAYEAWMVKRHIVRFYSIFLEKYASPTPVAKYDAATPKDKVLEMFNIIKRFQQKTAMTIPKNFEVEFLESTTNGEAFTKGINLFNMFIGRAIIIPDLLGFSGSETNAGGSQALGREQIGIFLKHVMRRRKTLEHLVNKHIIQPMATWNHGLMEDFPKFKLDPISIEDATKYADIFLKAVNGKAYKPTEEEINHFRSLIKFPEGAVEFFEEPQQGDPNDPNNPFGKGPKGKDKTPPSEDKADEPKGDKKEFAAYAVTEGDYAAKVNFKAAKSLLDASENKLKMAAKPIVDLIFSDLADQIQKKKILEGQGGKPDRIDSIKVKHLSQLKTAIKKALNELYRDSALQARSELNKSSFAEPLPSDQFLEFLEKESFQYVGDWEYQVSKQVRMELMNSIKDGRSISATIDMMDIKTKKWAEESLERYARTKHTEVMNRARVEEFEKSGVVQGYQYSAILDGRTTAICQGLHGKKFRSGTEPIPPLHFNCRSLLIPITIFEKFTPDKKVGRKDIDAFITDNKGEGFSTR